MKKIAWFLPLLLLTALLLRLPAAAASMAPDKLGCITVCLNDSGSPIPGGTVTLYRVAELTPQLEYVPTPDFRGCGSRKAAALAEFVREHRLAGQTCAVNHEGIARFPELSPGRYLILQDQAGPGFLPFRPFLVQLPQQLGDHLFCDIEAAPKTEPLPSEPPQELPKTGQTRWPVPVLGLAGLMLILLGLALCRPEGRHRHES